MLNEALVTWMLLFSMATPAAAQQVSIGFWSPNVSIGINLPLYPDLVPVPGYPVYYAPGLDSNYFFYDGMYWVYQQDNWYASSWYNGPWGLVDRYNVPLYVLRIPVRYYRQPPVYFRDWRSDAPPRWGEHWGNDWSQRRGGWDRWDRHSVPERPPLPDYQRKYSGDRYPHQVEQQHELQNKNYRYQPRDPVVRQHYEAERVQRAPAPNRRVEKGVNQERNSAPRSSQRSDPPHGTKQSAPTTRHTQASDRASRPVKQSVHRATPQQQPKHRDVQSQQPASQSRSQEEGKQGKDVAQESKRERRSDKEKDRENADDRGKGRGR
ncbi:MAG: hypothetical protein WAO76_06490 [Georgfuchsia sp.]